MTVDLEAILARWSGDLNGAFEDVREMAREIASLRETNAKLHRRTQAAESTTNKALRRVKAFELAEQYDSERAHPADKGARFTWSCILDKPHYALQYIQAHIDAANEFETRAKVAERELERWRHGVPIEGDYVCPYQLALTEVEWSGWTYPGEQPCCPSCRVLKSDGEHKDGCPFTVIRPNGGEGEQRNSSN